MFEISYRARITLNSGQAIDLHAPRLYNILVSVQDLEKFGISSIYVQKCRKVVPDEQAS